MGSYSGEMHGVSSSLSSKQTQTPCCGVAPYPRALYDEERPLRKCGSNEHSVLTQGNWAAQSWSSSQYFVGEHTSPGCGAGS